MSLSNRSSELQIPVFVQSLTYETWFVGEGSFSERYKSNGDGERDAKKRDRACLNSARVKGKNLSLEAEQVNHPHEAVTDPASIILQTVRKRT